MKFFSYICNCVALDIGMCAACGMKYYLYLCKQKFIVVLMEAP